MQELEKKQPKENKIRDILENEAMKNGDHAFRELPNLMLLVKKSGRKEPCSGKL